MVSNKRAPTGAHQDNSITSKSPRPVDEKPAGRPRICPLPNRMFSLRLPVYLIERMNELKRTGQIPSLTDFVITALTQALAAGDERKSWFERFTREEFQDSVEK